MIKLTKQDRYFEKTKLSSNKTKVKDTFNGRATYHFLFKESSERRTFIDLWAGEAILYGRVDKFNRAIFPKAQKIKKIITATAKSERPQQALDFVVDAFLQFRKFYMETSGCPDLSMISPELKPTAGWKNVNELYYRHLEKVFDIFVNEWLELYPKANERLKGLDSFLELLFEFIREHASHLPFTRTDFITSKLVSPLASGLIIEVQKKKHSDDEEKYETFLTDDNFDFYKNAAMRFGFLIDKNAPWRLVANLESPALKPFIEKYGTLQESVLQEYFFRAELHEFELFKKTIFSFYNSYVSENPNYISGHKKEKRKLLTVEEYKTIPESKWRGLFERIA